MNNLKELREQLGLQQKEKSQQTVGNSGMLAFLQCSIFVRMIKILSDG